MKYFRDLLPVSAFNNPASNPPIRIYVLRADYRLLKIDLNCSKTKSRKKIENTIGGKGGYIFQWEDLFSRREKKKITKPQVTSPTAGRSASLRGKTVND